MAQIDLTRDELWVRVSRHTEGPATPSAAAATLGATVLINGDWFSAGTPNGLSVGHGTQWPNTADPPIGAVSWLFFACTSHKVCFFDAPNQQSDRLLIWQNVVGGNEAVLVVNGVAQQYAGAFYDTDRAPRSAVCMDSTNAVMRFFVIQGRRPNSAGMTFNELANDMVGMGCHNGMMLDGGGSSGMVIDGVLNAGARFIPWLFILGFGFLRKTKNIKNADETRRLIPSHEPQTD
jgi:exopolysaccharide biosynthesis protein